MHSYNIISYNYYISLFPDLEPPSPGSRRCRLSGEYDNDNSKNTDNDTNKSDTNSNTDETNNDRPRAVLVVQQGQDVPVRDLLPELAHARRQVLAAEQRPVGGRLGAHTPPFINNPPLGRKSIHIFDYQFRRRHEFPYY